MYLRGMSAGASGMPAFMIVTRISSAHSTCVMFRYLCRFSRGRRHPLLNSYQRLCAICMRRYMLRLTLALLQKLCSNPYPPFFSTNQGFVISSS